MAASHTRLFYHGMRDDAGVESRAAPGHGASSSASLSEVAAADGKRESDRGSCAHGHTAPLAAVHLPALAPTPFLFLGAVPTVLFLRPGVVTGDEFSTAPRTTLLQRAVASLRQTLRRCLPVSFQGSGVPIGMAGAFNHSATNIALNAAPLHVPLMITTRWRRAWGLPQWRRTGWSWSDVGCHVGCPGYYRANATPTWTWSGVGCLDGHPGEGGCLAGHLGFRMPAAVPGLAPAAASSQSPAF